MLIPYPLPEMGLEIDMWPGSVWWVISWETSGKDHLSLRNKIKVKENDAMLTPRTTTFEKFLLTSCYNKYNLIYNSIDG